MRHRLSPPSLACVAGLALAVLVPSGARAQGCDAPLPIQEFVAQDTAAEDLFGRSVFARDGVAIVGAPGSSTAHGEGATGGHAYVYRRQPDGTWGEEAPLPSQGLGWSFGHAVCIDGDRAIVGAPRSTTGLNRGRAFVFEVVDGAWTRVGAIEGGYFDSHDFGAAVAIDGDHAVVGDPGAWVDPVFEAGRAYALHRTPAGEWEVQQELTHPLTPAARLFGGAVALRGDKLFVAAPNYQGDPELPSGGHEIFVYRPDGNGGWFLEDWVQDVSLSSEFGRAIDTDGVRLIASAAGSREARILAEGPAGTWSVQAVIEKPNVPGIGFGFGQGVALEGPFLAIGGQLEDSGAVFLYEETAPATWERRAMLEGDGYYAGLYRDGLDMDGASVLVGTPWASVHGDSAGLVTAYERCSFWPVCSGDGSGADCPCDNEGAPGSGCGNGSFPDGARLGGDGWPSVAADSTVLRVSSSAPSRPGLFFQADQLIDGGAGASFGDGLRCAGMNVVRLEIASADGAGDASTSVPLAATGGAVVGQRAVYQWWYRDPAGSPCGSGFNLSNALETVWLP